MTLDVGFVVIEAEAVLLTFLVVLFSLSFDGIIGRGNMAPYQNCKFRD